MFEHLQKAHKDSDNTIEISIKITVEIAIEIAVEVAVVHWLECIRSPLFALTVEAVDCQWQYMTFVLIVACHKLATFCVLYKQPWNKARCKYELSWMLSESVQESTRWKYDPNHPLECGCHLIETKMKPNNLNRLLTVYGLKACLVT